MRKPETPSCEIYKHLVQQSVQQVVHDLHDFFYRPIWFYENNETPPLKYNIYFSLLYCNFKIVL